MQTPSYSEASAPSITMDVQEAYLRDLFTRPATAHSARNLAAYIGELLSLGAVARIVKTGATIEEFKSPDQFAAYVDLILASQAKCPKCWQEFRFAPGLINVSNTVGCPNCGEVVLLG